MITSVEVEWLYSNVELHTKDSPSLALMSIAALFLKAASALVIFKMIELSPFPESTRVTLVPLAINKNKDGHHHMWECIRVKSGW